MAEIVLGRDQDVGKWVVSRVMDIKSVEDLGPFQAIGVAINKKIVAGFVFNNYTEDEIMLSLAAIDPRWCQKGIIEAVLGYPFSQVGVHRVSLICAKGNKRARKLAEGLGFRLEGTLKEHFDRKYDGIIYGMTKPECKWIKDNGKKEQPDATATTKSNGDSGGTD
jgi:RimJ/RimL family protein N-acetyltransferase